MSMKLYLDCIEFPLFICTLIHLKFHISTEIKETCLQPSKLREIFSQTRTNVKQQINFLQRCENLVWIFFTNRSKYTNRTRYKPTMFLLVFCIE